GGAEAGPPGAASEKAGRRGLRGRGGRPAARPGPSLAPHLREDLTYPALHVRFQQPALRLLERGERGVDGLGGLPDLLRTLDLRPLHLAKLVGHLGLRRGPPLEQPAQLPHAPATPLHVFAPPDVQALLDEDKLRELVSLDSDAV